MARYDQFEVKQFGPDLGVVFTTVAGKTDSYNNEGSLQDRIAILEQAGAPVSIEKKALKALQVAKSSPKA